MPEVFSYTSASIIQRLIKRYNLQGYPIEPAQTMIVGRTIVPVTDIAKLLQTAKNEKVSKTLVAAAGTYVPYFEVPSGKRWTLVHAYKDVSVAATALLVKRVGTALAMPWMIATATSEPVVMYRTEVNEGDSVGLGATGNGGDTDVYLWLDYIEEDAF